MSNRAAEYRMLIEDVIEGGLLDDEEIAELRDLLARVKRNMLAQMPAGGEVVMSNVQGVDNAV